jgi:hypothetical protein
MNPLQIILDNKKSYENLAERRSASYATIEKALGVVFAFVMKKKRILYGGMAIDLSLKASGHEGIYQKDAIPDFDIMSPDFYEDSNELANLLCTEQFENVSSINAQHITTRKVRVKFVVVADITYIPQNIYDNIPFIEVKGSPYDGLRVLHPDFQRMDIHRSFCIPLSNPPQEVILHRLSKDQKRFRLLDKQYPIELESAVKLMETKTKIVINKDYLQNTVIGGVVGYAFLYYFVKAFGGDLTELEPLIIKITSKEIHVQLNLDERGKSNRITIVTDHYENLVPKIKKEEKATKVTYKNRYLDNLRPRTITLTSVMDEAKKRYEIFDNKGELLPCYNLQKTINIFKSINKEAMFDLVGDSEENNQNIYISQPNHLLLYFMQKSFEYPEVKEYKQLYRNTMTLVLAAETAFKLAGDKYISDNYKYLPFFLSSHMYGEFNWSPSYIHLMRERVYNLQHIDDAELKKELLRPTFGFYPKCEAEIPKGWDKFIPDSSFLYRIDGKKVDSFEPLILTPI